MSVNPYARPLLFNNNAQTTLAGSISNVDVTISLAPGGGAQFGSIPTGYGIPCTITDASTGLLREIVLVTARTGDSVTVIRAQEGTTGLSWAANDLFAQLVTAGGLATMVQLGVLQAQATNYAVDIGAANAYLLALDPVLTTPVDGMPIRMLATNTNTTASTLDAGAGVIAIVRNDGSPLIGGEIVADGIYDLAYNDAHSAYQLLGSVGTELLLSSQCYLQRTSATVITLVPSNGNKVAVDGDLISLPAAGVTGANTGVTINGTPASNLAANTVYLVAIGITGIIEFWTLATGHNPDTTAGNIGVEVITGHPTKSLVGMIGTNGSNQFVDTEGNRQVISWFNRKNKRSRTTFTGDIAAFSSTVAMAEIDSSIRNTFLNWANDNVEFSGSGLVILSTSGLALTTVGFDGTTPELEAVVISNSNNFNGVKTGLSEGKHYATFLGGTSGIITLFYKGGTQVPDPGINSPANSLTIQIAG